MYLVVRKFKDSPRSKTTHTETLAFPVFAMLEAWVLRNGLTDTKVYNATEVALSLVEGNPEKVEIDVEK